MAGNNLLFVCVDCLRSDFVGTDHADTPFIDNLVASGIDYREMYATATTTTPCVTSFMTGTYSEHNGVYSLEEARLNESVPTLAEHLSAAGYETTAMVTGPIVADTGLDRGFDEYAYRDRNEELVGDWFDEAVATLEGLEEPFFCYLHLWEIHDPVRVPDTYDDPEYGRYPYARTLSALDRSLEQLCDHLPSNTAIALHGDHGEAFAYRDSYLHRVLKVLRTGLRYGLGIDTRAIERRLKRRFDSDPSVPDHFMEDGHGENVFDFASNVPFVLFGPDIDSATVERQVRQVDILPTLLEYVGVDPSNDRPIDGESLLPPGSVSDRDAYIRACGKSLIREANWQRAVRAADHKYVEYVGRDWDTELYDLETDPLELNPIENDRIATQLKHRMPEEDIRDGESLEIDGLLRDLGYK
ncbi:sulfatase [Halorubrum sp. SD683]|uniref:sulfatase family protein n=1 Tax=Halorubrum sp. SD683 TaxID=1855873 RepID=UPI000A2DD49F|nr:sulfatase-like hydrolase/transferase [Halorubrum sp. SD683]OTF00451.1 sulfatase [Halorubrum sp. SD683]